MYYKHSIVIHIKILLQWQFEGRKTETLTKKIQKMLKKHQRSYISHTNYHWFTIMCKFCHLFIQNQVSSIEIVIANALAHSTIKPFIKSCSRRKEIFFRNFFSFNIFSLRFSFIYINGFTNCPVLTLRYYIF